MGGFLVVTCIRWAVEFVQSLASAPVMGESNCFAVIFLFAATNFLNAFFMNCNGELNYGIDL